MVALSFRFDRQTIQYKHEADSDSYSYNTGMTTIKVSNVSEERRQEVSV
jgi:hypothetical protein